MTDILKREKLIKSNNLDEYKEAIDNGWLSVNDVNSSGKTALFYADIQKMKYLLNNGIDKNITTPKGETALNSIMSRNIGKNKKRELVNVIFSSGIDFNLYENYRAKLKNKQDRDLVLYLDGDNLLKLYKSYPESFNDVRNLDYQAYDNMINPPLFEVDLKGKEFFLSIGFDINQNNSMGENALFYISNFDEFKLLADNGIDIYKKKNNSNNFFTDLSHKIFQRNGSNDIDFSDNELLKIINYLEENFNDFNFVNEKNILGTSNIDILDKYISSKFYQKIKNDELEKEIIFTMMSRFYCVDYFKDKNFNFNTYYKDDSLIRKIILKPGTEENILDLLPLIEKQYLTSNHSNSNDNKLIQALVNKNFNVEELKEIINYMPVDTFHLLNVYKREIIMATIKNVEKLDFLINRLNIDVVKSINDIELIDNITTRNVNYFMNNYQDEVIEAMNKSWMNCNEKNVNIIKKFLINKERKELINDINDKQVSLNNTSRKRI